jgi:hypothetical protein
MAYSTGETIQAIDYNYLTWGGNSTGTYSGTINNLAMVWGTGFGYKGYGQTVAAISATTASATVTATQWAGLVYTLNKTLAHQGITQLASGSNVGITAGATITAFANVSSGVTSINSTSNVASASGTTTTGSGLTTAVSWPDSSSAQSTNWTRTATFASADQARYFFNAGGYISVVLTASNNNATSRSGDIVTLFQTNAAGFLVKNANCTPRTGTSGTIDSSSSALGYWGLTNVNQTMLDIRSGSATYTYTNDELLIKLKTNGVQGSNGDVGSIITFDFTLSAPIQTNSNFNDAVDVTATVRIDVVFPETTYLANTWGSVTIA